VISTSGAAAPPGLAQCFNPLRTADKPVPPPIATTRSGEVSATRLLYQPFRSG
jgi:hypothetical protein